MLIWLAVTPLIAAKISPVAVKLIKVALLLGIIESCEKVKLSASTKKSMPA